MMTEPMSKALSRCCKPAVLIAGLLPLVRLVVAAGHDRLGPDPVATLIHSTGTWSLVFLMLALAVTPARRLLRQQWLLRVRRMLGQYAFFYGCLHFAVYMWFDQSWDWAGLWRAIRHHPFITVGSLSLVALLPLSVTSTNGWVRRLGAARWQQLHRLVYPAAIMAVAHYWLEVKRDIREPLLYALLLALLLAFRVFHAVRNRYRAAGPS